MSFLLLALILSIFLLFFFRPLQNTADPELTLLG